MKRMLVGIMALVMGAVMFSAPVIVSEPVSAATCYCDQNGKRPGVQTTFFGEQAYDKGGNDIAGVKCSCDDGQGSNIKGILTFVIQVLTICIGVLGVLGIVITGFQYLTSAGNEEKTRKAKKRLLDIVIGLVVYVLMYAFLMWLLPSFGQDGESGNDGESSLLIDSKIV